MSIAPYPAIKSEKPNRKGIIYVSLGIILLCGFLLRYTGISNGLPYSDHWEEVIILHHALDILKSGDFHPGFLGYPSLSIYLNTFAYIFNYFHAISEGLLTTMAEVKTDQTFAYISHPSFYLAGRLLSVILGSLCIFFTFKLGEKYCSKKTGLMAALFLAFSFSHVEESRFIHPEILTCLMVAITILQCFYIMDTGKLKFYLLAGLFAGFAIGSRYNAVFIIFPLLFAHFLDEKSENFFNTGFFLMILFVGLGFFLAAPYTFLDLPGFLQAAGTEPLKGEWMGPLERIDNLAGWPLIIEYLKYYYHSGMGGLILAVSALAGIGLLGFIHNWKKQLMFISFPVAYFLYTCTEKIGVSRNLVPTLPFMAVMGAVTLVMVVDLLIWYFPQVIKFNPIILAVLSLSLIYPSAVKSLDRASEIKNYHDSRSEVVEWLRKNTPAGGAVAIMNETRIFKRDLENMPFTVDWFGHIEHSSSWYQGNNYTYVVTSDRYALRHWIPISKEQKRQVDTFNTFFAGVRVKKRFGNGVLRLDCYSRNPVITVLELKSPIKAGL